MNIVVQFTSMYTAELKEIMIGDHKDYPIPRPGDKIFVKSDNKDYRIKITDGAWHRYEANEITIFGKHQLPA